MKRRDFILATLLGSLATLMGIRPLEKAEEKWFVMTVKFDRGGPVELWINGERQAPMHPGSVSMGIVGTIKKGPVCKPFVVRNADDLSKVQRMGSW